MVGVRKAVYQHERTLLVAAAILSAEHGIDHEPGTRRDLCPRCKAIAAEGK